VCHLQQIADVNEFALAKLKKAIRFGILSPLSGVFVIQPLA
jgi:hypothetical protein